MIESTRISSALVMFVSVFAYHTGLASPPLNDGTFIYSSLCRETESGDAAGYRFKLVRANGKQDLYVEWSEGPKEGPAHAKMLVIDPKTSEFKFSIPAPGRADQATPIYTARGRISNDAITLSRWDWGDGQGSGTINVIVPRLLRSSDEIASCKDR